MCQCIVDDMERNFSVAEADKILDDLGTDDDAVADLSRAVALRDLSDVLVKDAVAALRESGASWRDVGAELGLSRQAAQQRYGR